MKLQVFAMLCAFTPVAAAMPTYANPAPMCGPVQESYVDPYSVSCSLEHYGWSSDNYGNLVPPPIQMNDGPSIRQGHWSDQFHRTPPKRRNILQEAEILTSTPFAAPLYGGIRSFGGSHEDAMNWAELSGHGWGVMKGAGKALQGRSGQGQIQHR